MCCPGCPKRGFLLPRIETVTAEEDRSQEPGPGHQEEMVAADVTKEEPDEEEDDLDDLLDDLELNPVIFKKQEDPAKDIVQANRDGDTSEADPGLGGLAWTCADCKMNLAGDKVVLLILCYTPALSKTSQVSELLEKTAASLPGVSCSEIARHEAWLAATQTLLHPHHYQADWGTLRY